MIKRKYFSRAFSVCSFDQMSHQQKLRTQLLQSLSVYYAEHFIDIIMDYLPTLDLESSILSEFETNLFAQLLEESNKNYLLNKKCKLIYSGKVNGFEEDSFKNTCHDKNNLICIIQTKKGNIFGGFTSNGWRGKGKIATSYLLQPDDKTFLFLIKSIKSNNFKPQIFNVKPNEVHQSMYIQNGVYMVFGYNATIYLCNNVGYNQNSSSYSFPKQRYLNAGEGTFDCIDFEVFQLIQ
eukprot:252448_1